MWYLSIPERTFFFQVSNAQLGTTHVICIRQITFEHFSGKHNAKQLQESDESPSGNKHPHICFYLCSWHWSKRVGLKYSTILFWKEKKNVANMQITHLYIYSNISNLSVNSKMSAFAVYNVFLCTKHQV